jgi:uncharacterized protein involved in exopolysaccharide biosynthesis
MRKVDLETRLFQLDDRFRPDSPEVMETRRELDKVNAMIGSESEQVTRGSTQGVNATFEELSAKRNSYEADLKGARAGLAVLEKTSAEMEARLGKVPELRTTLRSVDREVALEQDKFQQLIAKQAQAAVSLATAKAAMPSMRVVEYAMPPTEVTWPKTKILFPSAALLGLLFGIAAAMTMDYSSSNVRTDNIKRGPKALDLYSTVRIPATGRPFTVVTRGNLPVSKVARRGAGE